MKFAKRLDTVPPYLFVEISRKIAAKKAEGINVISFGIGDPAVSYTHLTLPTNREE